MGLEILHCVSVRPEDADFVLRVDDHPAIKRLQETGFVCLRVRRIGKSCMNNAWHRLCDAKLDARSGDDEQARREESEMMVIYPYELDAKLSPFLETIEDHQWFRMDLLHQRYDFLFVKP